MSTRSPTAVTLRRAREEDAASLFTLINEAYEVERGDDGPAFKRTGRFEALEEVLSLLRSSEVTVAEAEGVEGRQLLGAIACSVVDSGEAMYFGPFAVSAAHQGRGVGRALREHVERRAKEEGCKRLKVRAERAGDARGLRHGGELPWHLTRHCGQLASRGWSARRS